MGNKLSYPVTEATFHEYARDIFGPIRRGESVTTIWNPMSGRRKHNKFLIDNISLFKKELPGFEKYLLIYMEPLDLIEESPLGYLKLMVRTLVADCETNKLAKSKLSGVIYAPNIDHEESYSKLLDKFREILSRLVQNDIHIVFFIGEFDEIGFTSKIFYNNLMSLWNRFASNLHYIFLMRESVVGSDSLQIWGEISEIILQNIVYVPTLGVSDNEYIINQSKKEYGVKLSKRQTLVVVDICGGHPYLLKEALKILSGISTRGFSDEAIRNLFYDNYKLRWVMSKVFDARTDGEKYVLSKIALREPFDEEKYGGSLEFLKDMGLLKVVAGELRPFNKLFSRTIQGFERKRVPDPSEKNDNHIRFDEESGAIVYKDRTVEEEFSRQEHTSLTRFLSKSSKLVTREDLGDALWGKTSYEKYSDWAIDQLVSKLRKKLLRLGVSGRIVTIRGKGYKFLQS